MQVGKNADGYKRDLTHKPTTISFARVAKSSSQWIASKWNHLSRLDDSEATPL